MEDPSYGNLVWKSFPINTLKYIKLHLAPDPNFWIFSSEILQEFPGKMGTDGALGQRSDSMMSLEYLVEESRELL